MKHYIREIISVVGCVLLFITSVFVNVSDKFNGTFMVISFCAFGAMCFFIGRCNEQRWFKKLLDSELK